MIGHQLADAIKGELNIPIIFMTGVFRGGKSAMEARNKYGTLHYFEKPFEARKLIEALQTLARPEAAGPPPTAEDAFDVELDIDVVEEKTVEPMELTGLVRVTGSNNISATLTGSPLTAAPLAAHEAARVRLPSPGRVMTPGAVPGPA
jgi:FixJ family two-component response regulator